MTPSPNKEQAAAGGGQRQPGGRQQGARQPQRPAQGGQQAGQSRQRPSKTALGEQGRKGDDTVAHLDSGEVVVPKDIAQQQRMRQALEKAFEAAGLDMNRYEVGNEANSINPDTGYPEFYSLDDFEEDVSDAADEVGDAVSDAGDAAGELAEHAADVATLGQYSAAKDVAQGRDPELAGETREDVSSAGRRFMEEVAPQPDMPEARTPGRQTRDTGPTNQQQARGEQMRQRRRAALASGRASTILTGASGATDDANTRSRTLLGA